MEGGDNMVAPGAKRGNPSGVSRGEGGKQEDGERRTGGGGGVRGKGGLVEAGSPERPLTGYCVVLLCLCFLLKYFIPE